MSVFDYVKEKVTAREAFVFYGIAVNERGYCRCPFHNDRSPSMKVDSRYYCFGCHEHGDVIDFVSKYFSLPLKEAALKIMNDFGYGEDLPSQSFARPSPGQPVETKEKWLLKATDILLACRNYLRKEAEKYAPKSPDEEASPQFTEASKTLEKVEYILELATGSDKSERELLYREAKDAIDEIGNEIMKMNERKKACYTGE